MKGVVLEFPSNYLRHIVGYGGDTLTKLSTKTRSTLFVTPTLANRTRFQLSVQGTVEQAKHVQSLLFRYLQTIETIEFNSLLPQLYQQWIVLPHRRQRQNNNTTVLPLHPRLFSHFSRLHSHLNLGQWMDMDASQAQVTLTTPNVEKQNLLRSLVFNHIFFSAHEAMESLDGELYAWAVEAQERPMSSAHHFADGNTPFSSPRSKTCRVPSVFVQLNQYSLDDFFLQLTQQTGVFIEYSKEDVCLGEREVHLFGTHHVIDTAWTPLQDHLDRFQEDFSTWKQKMQQGMVLQVTGRQQQVHSLPPHEVLIHDALIFNQDLDATFHSQEEVDFRNSLTVLPTKDRLALTRFLVLQELKRTSEDHETELGEEVLRRLDPMKRAFFLLRLAQQVSAPDILMRLTEKVSLSGEIDFVKARGPWRRRRQNLLLRLGQGRMNGKLWLETMQYLDECSLEVGERLNQPSDENYLPDFLLMEEKVDLMEEEDGAEFPVKNM